MKKALFLICCFLISFTVISYSQSYPIPAPGSQWGELTSALFGDDYGSYFTYDGKDTIINDQTYQYWYENTFTRYEDNKLYKLENYWSNPDSMVELVYYDFNLTVNDSFLLPITFDTVYANVTDVSYITTLNGQSRKKIELWSYDPEFAGRFEWIEGIGDVLNTLFYTYQSQFYVTDIFTRLVCFSDSSGDVYKDKNFDYPCELLLDYEELKIDAGRDTTFCDCDDIFYLGGNPTVIYGEGPYYYSWTTINSEPASFFLDDTTVANPILNIENLMLAGESVTFVLTVNTYESQKSDSVTIRAVAIGQTLIYFSPEINKGDTLELPHNEFLWGIEPYSYYWSPDYNISDVNASNPLAWPDTSTTYHVYAIDSIGCKSPVDFVDVIVNNPSNVISFKLNKGESTVFPNPVNANSVLVFDAEIQSNLILKIINASGVVIYSDFLSENPFPIGRLIKQSGIYFYTIGDDSEILSNGRFVKD